MIFGKAKNLVGLDIGDNSIKIVEVKDLGRAKGYQLLGLALEPLSSEAIVDGSIMDSGLVIDAIHRAYEKSGIKNKNLATALSGHSVIIKRISLPVMSKEELAESIRWEAEQYIPFDIEDVNIDYQILEGVSLSGEGNMDVLLAAVKKERINDYVSVLSQAGLNPLVVDVDAFALQNAYEANYDVEPQDNIALIDMGASVTTIVIMKGANSVFWRDISIGGNQYTDAIQKELNLTAEQAEKLKCGEDLEKVSFESVFPIISSVTSDVISEIQKTVDFFKATTAIDEAISKIVVTGGASQIYNFRQAFTDRFGVSVEILNPFRKIIANTRDFPPELLNKMASSACVAVGLALRKAGEK
ncbi:MAG: type IV pilus assembly protein PilM [Acidobacteriota bacterium]